LNQLWPTLLLPKSTVWTRCRTFVSRWRRRWRTRSGSSDISVVAATAQWDYKVVQMVGQKPADATDASRKLGGSISPETLRNQFPEHYGNVNGRKQINDFLNVLGEDGWELVGFQQVGALPLMVFKRPKQLPKTAAIAKAGEVTPATRAE